MRSVFLLLALAGCKSEPTEDAFDPYDVEIGPYSVDVRWTSYGIPHIDAEDYGSAGYGMGYAFARDNACILADQVIKVRSERSKWFGPGEGDANLDSDFGWLHLGVIRQAEQGFRTLDQDLQDAIIGYAAGYNAYVAEVGVDALSPECAGAEWFPTVNHIDLLAYYLHMGQFASGYVFVDVIGNAEPPSGARRAPPPIERLEQLRDPKLGSNGWAIGRDKSADGRGMLLSNTHFPSQGERRWHESHLRIGDELDVYGVSLMGVPVINMGFNQHVAWTHTVSFAPRFTVYQLELVEDDPTTYLYDGEEEAMIASLYRIEVKGDDGEITEVDRTLYSSRFGPIVNMPVVGWTPLNAFSYRDVNHNNLGIGQTWRAMNAATDLESFKAANRDYQGIPWVHTLYADDEGNAWYADASVVPNLSPEAFAAREAYADRSPFVNLFGDYGVWVFEGADPVNAWIEDERAVRPGAIPFDDGPQLLRSDFVSNANENHWLSNPYEPLTGFSPLYGDTGLRRTPRTKMNNRYLMEEGEGSAAGADGKFSLDELATAALSVRGSVAEDLRAQVVTRCTGAGTVRVDGQDVDLGEACGVLAAWDNTSRSESVGAALWREFLLGGVFDSEELGTRGTLYGDGFDVNDPIYTPSTLADAPTSGEDPILQALGRAVLLLGEAGVAIDAPLGEVQVQVRGGNEYPVPGGQYAEGVISVATYDGRDANSTLYPVVTHDDSINEWTGLGPGGYVVSGGNSWVMAMGFGDDGPEARAVMVYSQASDANSPHVADQSTLYSEGRMRPIAYREADVAADTQEQRSLSYP
ncbi:MAG: hypothetical protein EP330_20615 [Deltaproteobacteria bacterium]|nr:MAG: hypothetical protein EP330_20615 [Deltaproteobacteria bacterium]